MNLKLFKNRRSNNNNNKHKIRTQQERQESNINNKEETVKIKWYMNMKALMRMMSS